MSQSHHLRMKTEPCISPESPFMRKPSRQMLKKLNFKKSKQTGHQQTHETPISPQPISYIHTQKYQGSGSTLKLKANTIELSSFKIMHQNMLLKNEIQELKKVNQELMTENKRLRTKIRFNYKNDSMGADLHLDKTRDKVSPMLSFSSLNLKINANNKIKQKQNNINQNNYHRNIRSIGSIKDISDVRGISQIKNKQNNVYKNITNNISSLLSSQKNRFRTFQSCRTLFDNDTTSIQNSSQQSGSRIREIHFSKLTQGLINSETQIESDQNTEFQNYKQHIMNLQIQVQSFKQKVELLQGQIQRQKMRSNKVQTQNEALYLHIQMNKRKLLQKQSKLKTYQNKEKRQKLFELSSQSDSFY